MDRKIHNILVCVDFSDYTAMVMEYAAELARDAQILIYNVINERDVNMVETVTRDIPGNISVAEYVKKIKQEREELLLQLIRQYFPKPGSNISYMVDVGMPSEQILKKVDEKDIDLIVMANKGKGNIARVLFGSAAEKVFRHSPVPVVSVRDHKHFKREKHALDF